MESAAATFCSNRLTIYGVFSIALGLVTNAFGNYTMKFYDINKDETYKHISITAFCIGVVLIAYGAANVLLKDNMAMCALSML
jgi:hypothetical protein